MTTYRFLDKTPQSEAEWFEALIELARFLRSPQGCPWDRKQTTASFAGYLADESAELLEACENNDYEHVTEELGDCLFTLLMSIAAGETEGRLDLEAVMRGIHEKMIRRHEHVFGDTKAQNSEDALHAWNRVKAQEKAEKATRKKNI